MNLISKISVAMSMLFSFSLCNAQVKNAKTESVKIYGNCEMCKKTIETAGSLKKVANVDWNKDSKMAQITYDSAKTNPDEILKRIALAGYDSDEFLAPDDVYNKLPGCCHYERVNKKATAQMGTMDDHSMHNQGAVAETKQGVNELSVVFENYFDVKDALVKSDSKLASSTAKVLLSNINAVKMDKLSTDEHVVWMKILDNVKSEADKISSSSTVDKQRVIFMDLSANFYDLLKVSKQSTAIYYQNCPMYNNGKGANWLSKDNEVKNPYYGSQMLTCGKTVETIK